MNSLDEMRLPQLPTGVVENSLRNEILYNVSQQIDILAIDVRMSQARLEIDAQRRAGVMDRKTEILSDALEAVQRAIDNAAIDSYSTMYAQMDESAAIDSGAIDAQMDESAAIDSSAIDAQMNKGNVSGVKKRRMHSTKDPLEKRQRKLERQRESMRVLREKRGPEENQRINRIHQETRLKRKYANAAAESLLSLIDGNLSIQVSEENNAVLNG